MQKEKFGNSRPLDDSDHDLRAARLGSNLSLSEYLASRDIQTPLDTRSNIPLKPGVIFQPAHDVLKPKSHENTPRHRPTHLVQEQQYYVITINNGDETGQSGIWAYPLNLVHQQLSHSPLGVQITIHSNENQINKTATQYKEIAAILDISALEGMGIDTTGIARDIDPSQGLINLSEFVANQ